MKKRWIGLLLRGMGMGAADVVPGVSGGTIAFISGIYEELIESIRQVDLAAIKLLLTGKWASFWKKINGNFLLAVFGGVFISVLSLARILEHLLENEPILIWAFFFGLILASTYSVSRKVRKWGIPRFLLLLTGTAIAVLITSITPATTTDASWFVLLSGGLASCAMILPGISGSFILLLLGKYAYALNAINELEFTHLLLLGLGALTGLVLFANFLSWLLRRFHDGTVAVLVGFMLGSLNKIWPWKETLSTLVVDGELKPLVQKNIWPSPTEASDQFWMALLVALAGVALIIILELVLSRPKKQA